jgi:hypothetical protein
MFHIAVHRKQLCMYVCMHVCMYLCISVYLRMSCSYMQKQTVTHGLAGATVRRRIQEGLLRRRDAVHSHEPVVQPWLLVPCARRRRRRPHKVVFTGGVCQHFGEACVHHTHVAFVAVGERRSYSACQTQQFTHTYAGMRAHTDLSAAADHERPAHPRHLLTLCQPSARDSRDSSDSLAGAIRLESVYEDMCADHLYMYT